MGQLELLFDPRAGNFWATVGVARGTASSRAIDTFGEYVVAKLVVDTGSNRSGISESVAKEIGLDVEKLPHGDVNELSGAVSHRLASDIVFWFLAGDPRPVQLQRVLVIPRRRKRVQGKQEGKWVRRGPAFGPSVSILGLDAVEALEGTLQMNMKNKTAWIEW